MKPSHEALHALLRELIDDQPETIPEIQEYTATKVAKLLHRSPGWVARHAEELGGYREGGKGWWHFPSFAIRRYQENQGAASARTAMRRTA